MLMATPELAVVIRLPTTPRPICNWPKVAASEKATPGATLVKRRSAPPAPKDTVFGSVAIEFAPIATELTAPARTCALAPMATPPSAKDWARAPIAIAFTPLAIASAPLARLPCPMARAPIPKADAFAAAADPTPRLKPLPLRTPVSIIANRISTDPDKLARLASVAASEEARPVTEFETFVSVVCVPDSDVLRPATRPSVDDNDVERLSTRPSVDDSEEDRPCTTIFVSARATFVCAKDEPNPATCVFVVDREASSSCTASLVCATELLTSARVAFVSDSEEFNFQMLLPVEEFADDNAELSLSTRLSVLASDAPR
jgi:hypothetical protein